MRLMIVFLSGLLFAIGLGISGMIQPHIVRGFLDVFGEWDPRLLGVMAGAIGIHGIGSSFILRRSAPILEKSFQLPTKKDIDRKLIFGAVIFGLGWGWAGICPGPGIVALVSGDLRFGVFIGSLLLGMMIFQTLQKKSSS